MKINTKDDYYEDILKEFLEKFKLAIDVETSLATNIVTNSSPYNSNAINLSNIDKELFLEKLQTNIKDANRDMSKRISNVLIDSMNTKLGINEMKTQLEEIFKEDNPNYYNYKNRFKTIARTESSSISNISSYNRAKELGASKKYLVGIDDFRQGDDSKVALAKYGSPDKAIPIDEPFTFTHKGKSYEYLLPPNRPKDRELAIYLWD